jgi:hypothetical protein
MESVNRSPQQKAICNRIADGVGDLVQSIWPSDHPQVVVDILIVCARREFRDDGETWAPISALPINEDMADYTAVGLLESARDMYREKHSECDHGD